MGNLTRDPELRMTAQGLSICKFSIATTRKYKGQDGNFKDETTFVDIDSFGKQAEIVSKYFAKGRPIFIEGRLKLDSWESNTGEKRSKLVVVLESFQFIGNKNDEASAGYDHVSPPSRQEMEPAGVKFDDIDEDVPF